MNVCLCGAAAGGYPHKWDCPFSYYGNTSSMIDKWHELQAKQHAEYLAPFAQAAQTLAEIIPSDAQDWQQGDSTLNEAAHLLIGKMRAACGPLDTTQALHRAGMGPEDIASYLDTPLVYVAAWIDVYDPTKEAA